jgi:hypothetical protein
VKVQALSRFSSEQEMRLVAAFFGNINGYFVEVGANDPQERSQTWHLERQGWMASSSSRSLILPQSCALCARRGYSRPPARRPAMPAGLPLHVAGPLSSLDRCSMAPGATPEKVINVPTRTATASWRRPAAPQRLTSCRSTLRN